MYIIPYVHGYVGIMKRKFNNKNNKNDYLDSLIWIFPLIKKKLMVMRINEENHLLNYIYYLLSFG